MHDPSEAVKKFRSRFAGIAEEERAAAPATAEARFRLALELSVFNLVLDLDRVRSQLGSRDDREAVAELNRQRLASPMPHSLAERARDVGSRSR